MTTHATIIVPKTKKIKYPGRSAGSPIASPVRDEVLAISNTYRGIKTTDVMINAISKVTITATKMKPMNLKPFL